MRLSWVLFLNVIFSSCALKYPLHGISLEILGADGDFGCAHNESELLRDGIKINGVPCDECCPHSLQNPTHIGKELLQLSNKV